MYKRQIELRVVGQVLVDSLAQGALGGEDSRLPVHAYCVQTPLTLADDTIQSFARDVLPAGLNAPADVLMLASAICDRVAYEPGTTDVTTAAGQVLALGHGVCQDHAHLFLACVREMCIRDSIAHALLDARRLARAGPGNGAGIHAAHRLRAFAPGVDKMCIRDRS